MKTASNRPKVSVKMLVTIVLGVLVIGLGLVVFALLYTGSKKPIESIADQFSVDSSWQPIASRTEPPRLICLGDNPCPSVHRAWNTNGVVSLADFEQSLAESGWSDFTVEGDCMPKENVQVAVTLCSAVGARDGFEVKAYSTGTAHEENNTRLVLSIRPE